MPGHIALWERFGLFNWRGITGGWLLGRLCWRSWPESFQAEGSLDWAIHDYALHATLLSITC